MPASLHMDKETFRCSSHLLTLFFSRFALYLFRSSFPFPHMALNFIFSLISPFLLLFLPFSFASPTVSGDYDAFLPQKHLQFSHNLPPSESKNAEEQLPWAWHRQKTKSKEYSENSTAEFVDIRISGGFIRGKVSYEAGQGNPAYLFKGIPMAEPPVGNLRFRPLQEKRPWGGVWDATKYSPACLSNTTRTRSPQHYISEDCIYMNVFSSPKCTKEKPCPVLFYIHGGGFAYDSATMFNDSQIVRKYASDGIVFLIPAYRLGVFGFLDLRNDRTVKRNLGLHDLVFALEWAQKEVNAFGGDRRRLTVMGNSAGGTAVALLCSSPVLTKRHFQQAVISSGAATFSNNTNLKPSKALLAHFNCSNDDSSDGQRHFSDWQSVECLRRVDAFDLLRQQQFIEENSKLLFVGPETDTELLPARNYAELLKYWKELPIMKMTTALEMPNGPDENLWNECANDCAMFNYLSNESLQKCVQRYNDTFAEEIMSADHYYLDYSSANGVMHMYYSAVQGSGISAKRKIIGIFLPSMAVAQMTDLVVPLRLLYVTTKNENEGPASNREFADQNANLGLECTRALYPLGYLSSAAHNECVKRYNATFYNEENMRVSYESMHAEAFLTALVNTREGGRSFVGEFEIANYSNHANDMYFFIGLHQIPMDRLDVRLMDWYYPQMIKNFVNGKAPDIDWKPQNWNGRNYFRITFNVSENGTLLNWPHGVDGYQDVAGLDFWLRQLPLVELNATREQKTKDEKGQQEQEIWQNVFVPKEWQEKGERVGRDQQRPDESLHSRLTKARTLSFMAKPPLEMVSMPNNKGFNGTPMDAHGKGVGEEEDGTRAAAAILVHKNDELAAPVVGDELHRVWSAFWLTLTVAVLLAVVLLLLLVNRRRKNRPYAYASNNSIGDSEFCTEQSRIYVANDANAMRYS